MSFLDLLCCGLGAMLLLFILSEQRQDQEIARQRADVARATERITESRSEAGPEALERIAAWADAASQRTRMGEATAQIGSDVADQIGMHAAARHLLILVDTSGSMSRYLPEEPEFADAAPHLRQEGLKWQATVDLIADTLARAVDFESDDGLVRFRIHRISDGTRGDIAIPIHPSNGDWAVNDSTGIARAVAALRAIVPAGGSNHHDAIEHALNCSIGAPAPALSPPADTILLITDGLPNHGPVGRNPPDARINPAPAPDGSGVMVSAASRLDRSVRVEALIRSRAAAGRLPAVHVLTLPWPDDSTLVNFGLKLTAPTGGSVVSIPPPIRP